VAIGPVLNWNRLCLTGHAVAIGYVLNWTCSVLVEEHQINFFVEEHRINLLLKEHQINLFFGKSIRPTFRWKRESDQLFVEVHQINFLIAESTHGGTKQPKQRLS
jgi:hypothetical protein